MKNNNEKKQYIEQDVKIGKKSVLTRFVSAFLVLAVAANAVGQASKQKLIITNEELTPPYVIEESVDMPPLVEDFTRIDDEDKQKKSVRMSISAVISFVIAWLVSTVTSLFPHLLAAFVTPLGNTVLSWLLFAAGIFIALVLALKKAFPNAPLKELLNKKRILAILFLTVIIIIICEWAMYRFKEFSLFVKAVGLILGLVLITVSYNKITGKINALLKITCD